jgi:hypothetical protein
MTQFCNTTGALTLVFFQEWRQLLHQANLHTWQYFVESSDFSLCLSQRLLQDSLTV